MYKLPKICLTVLYFIFCTTLAHAQSQGRLTLIVFDGDSETPLANTRVTFPDSTTALTDAKGNLTWNAPEGTYRLLLHVAEPPVALEINIQSDSITEIIYTFFPSGGDPETLIESKPLEENTGETEPKNLGPVIPVKGTVLSDDDNKPIEGVQIWVQDFPDRAITDANGIFETALPAGKINISFIHKQYALLIKKDFEINATNADSLVFKMTPKGLQLADFTVKAPHVAGGVAALIDQKEKPLGSPVLGAEEMKQNGDTNAAAALQRVTGLTVVGGRYVFVRGLGDQIHHHLTQRPTTSQPRTRKKSYSSRYFSRRRFGANDDCQNLNPDLPGAFGGGTILLKTKTLLKKISYALARAFPISPAPP